MTDLSKDFYTAENISEPFAKNKTGVFAAIKFAQQKIQNLIFVNNINTAKIQEIPVHRYHGRQ